ncbi:hypothetical protein CDCA_CDCA18G4564 [Cyanidium caldarium]|uniref:Nuclear pore complex protein Nup155 n=1 Tax=Cyanidium caldarium TaxID=2771 RepID=A0AAV9J1W4_CYACA|nr:hypothetical protein CDCA_CDCA18G4564 [Cyanidium caldarium]
MESSLVSREDDGTLLGSSGVVRERLWSVMERSGGERDRRAADTVAAASTALSEKDVLGMVSAAALEVDEAHAIYQRCLSPGVLWEAAATVGGGGEYVRSDAVHAPFRISRSVPVPRAIVDQYQFLECKSFMGLLPEIGRAWITMDHRLFLWDYVEGGDFCVYDELDQIITAVGLAAPRPDVFIDEVEYVLVVATATEVVLLGVMLSPATAAAATAAANSVLSTAGTGRPAHRLGAELSLVPTGLSVPTDGIAVLKVVGSTVDGSIFLAGRDGCLHELVYQAEASWPLPGRKVRRLNRSRSIASALMPPFLRRLVSADDPLIDLSLDDSRGHLYTLSERGTLRAYRLGRDGDGRTRRGAPRIIASVDVAAEARHRMVTSRASMVNVFAVCSGDSRRVHAVAVSSLGERFYYTTSSRWVRGSMAAAAASARSSPGRDEATAAVLEGEPDCLTLVGYRAPVAESSRASVHTAFWSHGVLLCADERGKLLAVMPDPPPLDALQTFDTDAGRWRSDGRLEVAAPTEMVGALELGLKAWAMAAAPSLAPGDTGSGWRSDRPQWHPVEATSSARDRLEYVCLTPAAVFLLSPVRPVDHLRRLLADGASHDELLRFFRRYGTAHACALCVALAAAAATGDSTDVTTVTTAATQLWVTLGGEPSLRQHETSMWEESAAAAMTATPTIASEGRARWNGGLSPSTPVAHAASAPPSSRSGAPLHFSVGYASAPGPSVIYSGRHDGLLLHLGGVLGGVWREPILQGTSLVRLRFSYALLITLRSQLQALTRFMDTAMGGEGWWTATAAGTGADGASSSSFYEAHRAERQSLAGVYWLVRRCVQALELLRTVLESAHFPRLVAALPDETRGQLLSLRFRELVATQVGARLASLLAFAMLDACASEDGGGGGDAAEDALVQALCERCPWYFGDHDVAAHRGLALLRQARLPEAMQWLRRAARARRLSPVLVSEMRAAGAYAELVELARLAGDVRLMWECLERLSEEIDEEHGESKPTAAERHRQLQQALRYAVQSDNRSDVDWERLFAYGLARGPTGAQLLLQLPTAVDGADGGGVTGRLEAFLKQRDAELLWKVYAQGRRYADAAAVLLQLAQGLQPPVADDLSAVSARRVLPLADRLAYLTRALQLARAGASAGDARATELATELGERVEVAQVQMRALQEFRRIVPRDGRTPEYEAVVRRLDAREDAAADGGGLLDLSTLYKEVARPYALWETELDAIRCAGYRDEALVRRLWNNVMARELAMSRLRSPREEAEAADGASTGGLSPEPLQQRWVALARAFYPSETALPLPWLVASLEMLALSQTIAATATRDAERLPPRAWQLEAFSVQWLQRVLRTEVGVPRAEVLQIYRRLSDDPEAFYAQHGPPPPVVTRMISSASVSDGPAAAERWWIGRIAQHWCSAAMVALLRPWVSGWRRTLDRAADGSRSVGSVAADTSSWWYSSSSPPPLSSPHATSAAADWEYPALVAAAPALVASLALLKNRLAADPLQRQPAAVRRQLEPFLALPDLHQLEQDIEQLSTAATTYLHP